MKDIIGMALHDRDVFTTPAYNPDYTLNPALDQLRSLIVDLPLSGFPTSAFC